MATFEEQLPEWNEPGVEPPQSKKNSGYEPGDKPPAQWMNWFMTRVYKVLQEIRAKVAFKADVGDMSTVPTTSKTAAGAIAELFTNVSDGKALIASAITDKGVPTDADDTFGEMANNIEAIPVGPDTSDATATAGDILAPKTAYGSAGSKLTGTLALTGSAADADVLATKTYYNTDAKTKRAGTMADRGNMSFTPGPTAQTIPAGKHGGSGQVAAVIVPANKVLAGTTIAGTAGTIPIRGNEEYPGWRRLALAPVGPGSGRAHFAVPTGAYLTENVGEAGVGNTGFFVDDPNYIAQNIPVGISIFGLAGSKVIPPELVLLNANGAQGYQTTYTIVAKIRVDVTGILRFQYLLRSGGGFEITAYGVMYKNGAQFGQVNTSTTQTGVTVVQDLPVNSGDIIDFRYRTNNGSSFGSLTQISVSNPISSPTGGAILPL